MGSTPYNSIARLYDLFARYDFAGKDFCGFCYTPDEIEYITYTPIHLTDVEHGRKLLLETADHWENVDVYRHYLPRLLELIGPPWFLDDMYPLHLKETLLKMGFYLWPRHERQAIVEYLESLKSMLEQRLTKEEYMDWIMGFRVIKASVRGIDKKEN